MLSVLTAILQFLSILSYVSVYTEYVWLATMFIDTTECFSEKKTNCII